MVDYCKKIIYGNAENPKVILGIITEKDPFFITVKTAKNVYQIGKAQIISIEETKQPFSTFDNKEHKNLGVWS